MHFSAGIYHTTPVRGIKVCDIITVNPPTKDNIKIAIEELKKQGYRINKCVYCTTNILIDV